MKIDIKQFISLTPTKQEELQKLFNRSLNATASINKNLQRLIGKLPSILEDSLFEFIEKEKLDVKAAEKLFNITLKNTIKALAEAVDDTYQEQLKTQDIFIFDGILVEKVLQIFEKTLEFKKKLDETYPGPKLDEKHSINAKIVKSLKKLLVAVIAAQLPLVGFFIKINSYIDHKDLLPKVKKWQADIKNLQNKVSELKDDKQFNEIIKTAEKVVELSEKIEVPLIEIVNSNLSDKELDKANETIKNDKEANQDKGTLRKIIEIIAIIPTDRKAIDKKISGIKEEIEKLISKASISDKIASVQNIQNIVTENLNKVGKELLNVISPETSFVDKILSLNKFTENMKELNEKVKENIKSVSEGNNLVTKIETTVKKHIEAIIPKQIIPLKDLILAAAGIIGKKTEVASNMAKDVKQTRRSI